MQRCGRVCDLFHSSIHLPKSYWRGCGRGPVLAQGPRAVRQGDHALREGAHHRPRDRQPEDRGSHPGDSSDHRRIYRRSFRGSRVLLSGCPGVRDSNSSRTALKHPPSPFRHAGRVGVSGHTHTKTHVPHQAQKRRATTTAPQRKTAHSGMHNGTHESRPNKQQQIKQGRSDLNQPHRASNQRRREPIGDVGNTWLKEVDDAARRDARAREQQ